MKLHWIALSVVSGLTCSAFAQDPLPFFIDFEEPTYSTTGNGGGGILYNGTTGQGNWAGGGAYSISTDQAWRGSQSLKFRTDIAYPIAGTTFSARKRNVAVNTGIVVADGYIYIHNDPDGSAAFALEMWANNYVNRMASIGFTDTGQAALRRRSDFGPELVAANAPFGSDRWIHATVVYDIDRNVMYGYADNQTLVDSLGQPLAFSITDLTTFNFDNLGLGGFLGGNNRTAFGVPAGELRGRDFAYFDDLRMNNYATGVMEAKVNLSDYSVSTEGQAVTVEILDMSDTVVETLNGTVDANGYVTVSPTSRGQHKVRVKASHWLAKKLDPVWLTDTGVYHLVFDLINGDVDGDNEVGGSDLSEVSGAFLSADGDPNFNPMADLDGDGEVGSSDLSILSTNFLLAGD